MILALSIILIVFLGLSVVVLTGALCALCMGFYEDFCAEEENKPGD